MNEVVVLTIGKSCESGSFNYLLLVPSYSVIVFHENGNFNRYAFRF